MLRKIWVILKDFAKQMGRQNISAHAASTTFFLFLSVVPMLIVLSSIIPYTSLTREDLSLAITQMLPDAADPLAEALVAQVYEKSGGVLSFALIATIWSAGRGVLALMRGLNAIGDYEERRHYFYVRFMATAYTVVMLLVVLLSLFFMVFGNQLLYFVMNGALHSFFMNTRFLMVWIILTVLFSAIYAYIPDKKLKFKDQITGASFAAVGWSIFSWGFSLYVNMSDSYSVYGSLSIIIIVMVWLYFCIYIMMAGAYMNLYLAKAREKLPEQPQVKVSSDAH
ncbi:MAG: YihY/virulence factor BrkB family protein [Clostridium sp.]|nr:YihY/virulence factor BrkB family protein [Clostridium sp.]